MTTTPRFLSKSAPPVLVFGGKGGVGKTTMSCAAAIHTSRQHPASSVALVSTDPAHNLRDAIAMLELPPNLSVLELDAADEHARFMAAHADTLKQIAARGTFFEDADIARFLDLSLPGVDELMNFLWLARAFEDETHDRFVVDTAPTGHALRLLTMPAVTEDWMTAIEALLGKHRYMAGLFGSGNADDPVEDFVEDMQEILENITGVLADADLTQFVPVANAEILSIAETERLLLSLDELGIAAPEVIINRLVPPDAEVSGSLAALRTSQQDVLRQLPDTVTNRNLFRLPLQPNEPIGPALADLFTAALAPGALAPDAGDGPAADAPVPSAALPLAARLTLFAGKGGVGKTTISSSAAAASAAAGRRTLLVSTDPAGSLGDAFEREITADPTAIVPNLDAIQLDADRELDALKAEYRSELEGFFDSLSVDLDFEKEALESLLDLAPPGIDEVMALVRITEILDAGEGPSAYDAIILDTAPTGHTLRLLELPALIQSWLEQIFAILVAYENLIHLPRLNERLLALSRGLKSLRSLLADPSQTGIVAVTIPTAVAAAETRRLTAACDRLGVPLTAVVVNQLTTPGPDVLSTSLAAREDAAAETMRRSAGDAPVATVTRGESPRGHAALEHLGRALFAPHAGNAKQAA